MTKKSNLSESLKKFENLDHKDEELNKKLSEFIKLLKDANLDSENIKDIQDRFNGAIEHQLTSETLIKELQEVSMSNIDTLAQLDKLEFLLINNHLDSKEAKKITFSKKIINIIQLLIGFLFVTLGFAMIIMPAPPYFEMFTIFYFNPNDGVTLMDLISLIIIAVGIYIIVKSIINLKPYE